MRRGAAISISLLVCVSWANAASPNRIREAADSRQTKVIRGIVHRMTGAEADRGALDASTPIDDITMVVKLSPDQQAELDALIRDQQNPSSPQYHRWLTPEQYGERFGLSSSDEAKVTAWLASEGLQAERTRSHNAFRIRGTAGQVSRAFRTDLHRFTAGGQNRFAATIDPSVPSAFSDVIAGFIGFDDFPLESKAKVVPPNFNSGTSHFLVPEDFATIYNLKPLYAAGIDGTGMNIAVVGQSNVSLSDIRAFRTRYGLPANDPKMVPYSGVEPGVTSSQIEGILDLEWAGAVAPKATITYVYGTNALTAMAYSIQQNIAPIISVSYGGCETDFSPVLYRAIVQQASAQGITILVASGDSGAAACNLNGEGPIAPRGLGTQFPASLPEVTAVGGTQFVEGTGNYWAPTNSPTFGSALSYIPEHAWNESSVVNGLASTGGGISKLYPKPLWQSGVPDGEGRHVPDIALSAAIHDAYMIHFQGINGGIAGTSASAPAMAGIIALVNHYQIAKGLQSRQGLGNINPQLYRLAQSAPAVFHDVVDGDNIVPCLQASPDCLTGSFGYKAGIGYDMATGLGSVDGNALATQWNTETVPVTMTLVADPGPRTLNDSVQLTATVSPGVRVPGLTGTVTFILSLSATTSLPLGSVPVINGRATLLVPLYVVGATGSYTFTAQYSGDAAVSAAGASLRITITPVPAGSGAVILPSQVPNVWPNSPDAQGLSWNTPLALREIAGVPAMLTGFTIDGEAQDISKYFPSPNIPPNGTLSSVVAFRNLNAPVTRTFGYSGIDATGRTWSRQVAVLFLSRPSYSYFTLSATPLTAVQNPSADPSCQWSVQLNVDDQGGDGVNLINGLFLGNGYYGLGANLTSKVQQIFGASRLDAFGGLQGTMCFENATPGATTQVFVGMSNQQFQEVSVAFAGPAAKPMKITAAPANLRMATAAGGTTEATLDIGLTDTTQSWSAAVFPANRTTGWLKMSALSGTGNGKITLTADATGYAPGVYRANIAIHSPSAVPQLINVPVMFVIGGSNTTSISGGLLYGSTVAIASPGTLFNITGTNLAKEAKTTSSTPLANSLA